MIVEHEPQPKYPRDMRLGDVPIGKVFTCGSMSYYAIRTDEGWVSQNGTHFYYARFHPLKGCTIYDAKIVITGEM